jgi:hypothetical protein
MKVPADMQFHGFGYRLLGGHEIPEELAAKLGADHPLIKAAAKADIVGPLPETPPKPAPPQDIDIKARHGER